MSKVGCRPYWLPSKIISTEVDTCTNATQLDDFLKLMSKVEYVADEKELLAGYSCLKPCRFIEYKVSNTI